MDNRGRLFSSTEDEALRRYDKYKGNDPLPSIPFGLLSSGQIQAYIARTGLVYPYFPSKDKREEKVTSACLIMTVGPEVLFWDKEGDRQYCKYLNKGDEIILRPNSITFLRPAERVNIPDYIAARFNFRIVHVHRGLLLGTGPLLDPGFKGYPMIPVHNLTENEYRIHVGDKFINVEFTKLDISDNGIVGIMNSLIEEPIEYKQNSGKALDFEFTSYIHDNVPQGIVKSSLSGSIDKATIAANEAINRANEIKRKTDNNLTVGIISFVLALGVACFAGYQLTISAVSTISQANDKIYQENKELIHSSKFEDEINRLQKSIDSLDSKLKKYEDLEMTLNKTIKQELEIKPATIRIENVSDTK